MKPKLYIETTIPSYLTSRPSQDLIVAGHQQITREWWDKRRGAFDIYISQFVVDEAKAGDPKAARERMKVIRDLPLLDITPRVEVLAASLLASRVIPRRAVTDAAHIAIAAVHGMDFPHSPMILCLRYIHIYQEYTSNFVRPQLSSQSSLSEVQIPRPMGYTDRMCLSLSGIFIELYDREMAFAIFDISFTKTMT